MKNILYIIFLFEFALGQTIQINEIVSSNTDLHFDEDGDSPDWIEIYNYSDQTLNLSGVGITDDPEDLSKWVFPSMVIEPDDFLVIFASDKDRTELVNQWDAKIDWGDSWHYWVGLSAPVDDWELPETDISFWSTGNSGFGYGDNDDNTTIPQTISIYIKKEFIVDDPSIVNKMIFHLDYDDGYVAYLNGIEFSRRNLGPVGSSVYYNTTTTGLHEAEIYSGGSPEPEEIDLASFPLETGTNTLAIEVHNYSHNSSDLSCIPFLTLGYNTEIENISEPNPLLNLPAAYLHTNFKLSSDGETILISDSNEVILDSITFGSIQTNMSLGRLNEGENWFIFDEPTPGTTNTGESFIGALPPLEISYESGFFNTSQIDVEISCLEETANIFYTLDGSVPNQNDNLYQNPVTINSNTVLRARSFLTEWVPSDIASKTYIFENNETDNLPIVFITTDPNSFFDEDTGMYVMGPNASWDFPYFGANFWEDWERPIHFEILETDGSRYAADAGAKIFGGWSRAFPQKSLSIFSRSYIGPSSFDYQLFPNSEIDSYEAFVLRNSGNDWESTVLRDGFITSIANDLNIDYQLYRPAVLYINGEFWGIQNIREKINEHFIASKHSISSEHIDLLDLEGINEHNIINGTNTDYQALITYLETEDMNDPLVENALENWIDIESYMSYQAFQIFIDNRDWPGNNIKFWRDHRVGGKWRWILYDTDFGFGIWNPNAYTTNTLEFALDPNGPGWPNPPWSTFVFRKLIENNHFKNTFINLYCDLLNTVFQPEFLTTRLDSISQNIENMIPYHRSRWYNNGDWPNSAVNWEEKVGVIENFGFQRRTWAILHLKNYFELPNIAQVSLNKVPESGGSIEINSLEITESGWFGYYFPTVPIKVMAKPNEGYVFSHWEEFPDSSLLMNINIIDPFTLTAVFTESSLTPGTVVINEINYNSSDDHDSGDWIELFNPGESSIDLTDWVVRDDNNDHSYILPNETILNSQAYLIISNDLSKFQEFYSTDIPISGPFDFGLSGGGDEVRIFNDIGELVDSVQYDDNEPWPIDPDGEGPTLELINPNLENDVPQSWASSEGYGTPGEQNSTYQYLDTDKQLYLPNEIQLYASYPNPFNSGTTIPFYIPVNANDEEIHINVYNLRGQLVNTILNTRLHPGKHEVQWQPAHISSGVYFLQLIIGHKTINQKITYLK